GVIQTILKGQPDSQLFALSVVRAAGEVEAPPSLDGPSPVCPSISVLAYARDEWVLRKCHSGQAVFRFRLGVSFRHVVLVMGTRLGRRHDKLEGEGICTYRTTGTVAASDCASHCWPLHCRPPWQARAHSPRLLPPRKASISPAVRWGRRSTSSPGRAACRCCTTQPWCKGAPRPATTARHRHVQCLMCCSRAPG